MSFKEGLALVAFTSVIGGLGGVAIDEVYVAIEHNYADKAGTCIGLSEDAALLTAPQVGCLTNNDDHDEIKEFSTANHISEVKTYIADKSGASFNDELAIFTAGVGAAIGGGLFLRSRNVL